LFFNCFYTTLFSSQELLASYREQFMVCMNALNQARTFFNCFLKKLESLLFEADESGLFSMVFVCFPCPCGFRLCLSSVAERPRPRVIVEDSANERVLACALVARAASIVQG